MPSYELIVKVFADTQSGQNCLQHLRRIEKEGKADQEGKVEGLKSIRLFDLAAIIRDPQGNLRVIESRDVSAPAGLLVGALVGALVGLLGGPMGAIAGAMAGAVTGGAIANRLDLGFSNAFLHKLKEGLDPGQSLILILVEQQYADVLLTELEQFPGRLLRHVVKDQLLEKLRQKQPEEAQTDDLPSNS